MKKGKRGKGGSKNQPAARFKTRYEKDAKGNPIRIHFPVNTPEAILGVRKKFEQPDKKLKRKDKPRATVHDINVQRVAKGLQPVTTASDAAVRNRMTRSLIKEIEVYQEWSDKYWATQKVKRDDQILSYYSNLKARKDECKERRATILREDSGGKPDGAVLLTQDLIDEARAKAKTSNGYAFASKKAEIRTGLTPSGRPITDFLEGGKFPPKEQRLQSVTKVPESVNVDNPSVPDVKWFINNVAPEYWPDNIKANTYYASGEWKPDKSKLLASKGMSLNSENESLEELVTELQGKLAKYEQDSVVVKNGKEYRVDKLLKEIEGLTEQNFMLNQELSFAHWEIAVSRDGEAELPAPQASDKVKLASVSSLAQLFNVFKGRVNDNILRAFCVYHGIEGREKELKAHINLRKEQRDNVVLERLWCETMARKIPILPHKGIVRRQRLRKLRAQKRVEGGMTEFLLYKDQRQHLLKERLFYRRLKRRDQPAWLSKLDHREYLHARMCEYREHQRKVKRFNEIKQRSATRTAERFHTLELMSTKTYKVLKATKDFFDLSRSPVLNYRKNKKLAEEASRIKRMAEQEAERPLTKAESNRVNSIAFKHGVPLTPRQHAQVVAQVKQGVQRVVVTTQ